MPEKTADATTARQVELAVSQLDCLSTLPCTEAQLFSRILESGLPTSDLADIIESDPAFTTRIFLALYQQDRTLPDETCSVRRAVDKLPADVVHNALFSVKVASESDNNIILTRGELTLHCLAVACCAKEIAQIIPTKINPQLAYSAGLLHDIGKLALEQVMPKSFVRIVEEAKAQNAATCAIEKKYLGTDHTLLGKRLTQKWHLPKPIVLAVWLHHSDTNTISQSMPEAKIAQVVQLADSIVRQCGIGQSGSYDTPEPIDKNAQLLSITPKQLQQIRTEVVEQVEEKSKLTGLDSPKPQAYYYDLIHTTSVKLAQERTKISQENRRLQIASDHFNFITEFLSALDPNASVIETAQRFAVRWQKFYQTGRICLYLAPLAGSQSIEAVIVENLSQSKIVCLNPPADSAAIPKQIANNFAILDAHDYLDWLFEQLDVDFDPNQTKLMPLLSAGKAIGAIAFELRYPSDTELFCENFKITTSIAGTILDIASESADRQHFAEQFAQLLGRARPTEPTPVTEPLQTTQEKFIPTEALDALAEMAAGAAHELNNPLSVISGQSQLLDETETDEQKKQILKQIQENTNEMSQIIEDLMSFARPHQPRPAQVSIEQIVDEAAQLAAQRAGLEQLDIQTESAQTGRNVFVDSAQIVSAIANVFSNSLESYTNQFGPIRVTVADGPGDFVKLQIIDLGCGMDVDTIRKATQPFFSAKPAGRKRGMGLAHTARLVQMNGGSMQMTSQPDSGTSVTILLPIAHSV